MHTRSQFKQFKQSEKSVKKLSGQRKNILREKKPKMGIKDPLTHTLKARQALKQL